MKVTREQAAANRERVLDTAARLFREKGYDGIGVADIMKAAGLTHGGFYGQFSSKEDLIAQASQRALDEMLGRLESYGTLRGMTEGYLSERHRDAPGQGCLFAALGGQVARQGARRGVERHLELLGGELPRMDAIVAFCSMLGAQILARAVDDEALSKEILGAVSQRILGGRTTDGACQKRSGEETKR